MCQRESQCCVKYPAEVYDDEEITPSGIIPITDGAVSFIRGWNFVTDLYRVLEHMKEFMQTKQAEVACPGGHLGRFFAGLRMNRGNASEDEMLVLAQQDLENLPRELKIARPMTGDLIEDRYGFQGLHHAPFHTS